MERRLSQSQSQGRETKKIGSDMPNHTSPGLKISICRRLGQRHSSECLQPSVEQDECSVMVWSCTSASGLGDLVTINGIVNTEKEISDFDPLGKRLDGVSFVGMTMSPNKLPMQ